MSTKEPPCTERYARWCERTDRELIPIFLLNWEIDGVNKDILQAYLNAFSLYNPKEYKVIIMDNAGFHSLKGIGVPENISIVNIPPYSPELNPCEQVYISNTGLRQGVRNDGGSEKLAI